MRLVYDSGGRLSEDGVELARVEDGAGPGFARVTIGGAVYDITRRRRRGYHFRLLDGTGERVVCDFHPHWLRRGGKLRGEAQTTNLSPPHLLRPHAWRIVPPGGSRISVKASGRMIGDELSLTSEESLSASLELRAVLAFACWLIVQWDHVESLNSSGIGASVAGP